MLKTGSRPENPMLRLLTTAAVCVQLKEKQERDALGIPFLFGSPSWTRTNDTAVNSRVLYRLSYGGI